MDRATDVEAGSQVETLRNDRLVAHMRVTILALDLQRQVGRTGEHKAQTAERTQEEVILRDARVGIVIRFDTVP